MAPAITGVTNVSAIITDLGAQKWPVHLHTKTSLGSIETVMLDLMSRGLQLTFTQLTLNQKLQMKELT